MTFRYVREPAVVHPIDALLARALRDVLDNIPSPFLGGPVPHHGPAFTPPLDRPFLPPAPTPQFRKNASPLPPPIPTPRVFSPTHPPVAMSGCEQNEGSGPESPITVRELNVKVHRRKS